MSHSSMIWDDMMVFQNLCQVIKQLPVGRSIERPGPSLAVTNEGKMDTDHLKIILRLSNASSLPGEISISSLPAKPPMSEMQNSV